MVSKYVYPALFDYADDGISISFPDLEGCLSFSETTEEALKDAEEVLGLWMYNMELDNEVIPTPSKLENIKCESNQKIVLIHVR